MPDYGSRYRANVSPEFIEAAADVQRMPFAQAADWYEIVIPALEPAEERYLAAADRFYLMCFVLGRHDFAHSWLYDRVREVENAPDEHLDLWAREHGKSSTITQAGTIQEIINDPDVTIGIFSYNQATAGAFLRQIQQEMERNDRLKLLFPEIFWQDPKRQSPLWNRSVGLIVQRSGNPKEPTVSAYGLVDGQPTSKHFALRIYDDVVTRESVTTPEMIKKTTEAWELSDNLSGRDHRRWHIGTRYHHGDTYGHILGKRILAPRIRPATHNGKEDGTPVLWTREVWEQKKKTQRSTYAAQLLLDPLSGAERVFYPQWMQGYEIIPAVMNVYIMVDPSRGRSATSDNTAMAVVGITEGGSKYLLDGYRHRMRLSERWAALRDLYKKWSRHPGVQVVRVGYERYGQQSDDEYIMERMQIEKDVAFALEELAWPREGGHSKQHRVERLEPDFKTGRFYLPALIHDKGETFLWRMSRTSETGEIIPTDQPEFRPYQETKAQQAVRKRGEPWRIAKPIRRLDENREPYDLTQRLIDEMLFFPFSPRDDLVDATSRIYDMMPVAPVHFEREYEQTQARGYEDA